MTRGVYHLTRCLDPRLDGMSVRILRHAGPTEVYRRVSADVSLTGWVYVQTPFSRETLMRLDRLRVQA